MGDVVEGEPHVVRARLADEDASALARVVEAVSTLEGSLDAIASALEQAFERESAAAAALEREAQVRVAAMVMARALREIEERARDLGVAAAAAGASASEAVLVSAGIGVQMASLARGGLEPWERLSGGADPPLA